MKYPLVSILISTYNSERFIKGAIDSALAQTWPNFEVVVIDDASTDHTREIITAYKDDRIRYIRQEKNIGILLTRNNLFKEARGDFFTFLDSDDRYLPDKIKEEAEFLLVHPDYTAVYCDMRCFFEDSEKLYYHKYQHYHGDVFREMLDGIFIANTTFMMRRAVVDRLGGYDPSTGIVEDWEYFLRMSFAHMKFGFVDKDLARVCIRSDSASNFGLKTKSQESGLATLEKFNALMSREERERYQMAQRIMKRKIRLAIAYLSAGRKKDFYQTWSGVRKDGWWRVASWPIFLGVAILPAGLFRFAVESAAKTKKANLFVPVS
jgi:glycosyltransferase involved in cell wall biosynthesis